MVKMNRLIISTTAFLQDEDFEGFNSSEFIDYFNLTLSTLSHSTQNEIYQGCHQAMT